MAGTTVALAAGEGTAWWVLGGRYTLKASSEDTGGVATIMEMSMPEGMGPPPHTHPGGEAVYVVEGKIRYHIGDDVIEAGPGAFFSVPADTLEWFEPVGETPARIVVVYTPGGIEKFFAEIGETATAPGLPPPADAPPDLERIIAVAAQHGMNIVAPAG